MTRKFWMSAIRILAMAAAVALPGMACSYSMSAQVAPASGGVVTVQVNTQAGCHWQVTESAGWLSSYAGMTGTGPGMALLYAQPNYTGAARSTTLHVVYTVTCSYFNRSCGGTATYIGASTTETQLGR
ncbi:MAG TPA: hypothetical protein VKE70_26040 [Candidatus Solibacter sp.]|nr:hypothetical protein [Candidatus Solibacter sp.]